MTETPVHFLSIAEVGERYRRGTLSPTEVARRSLDRIAALDSSLNSFITVLEKESLAEAAASGRELAAGHDRGPLHGIPVAIKDLIDVAGAPTTFASLADSPKMAMADAALVRNLRQAGAVIVGKTNLLEYAYGAVHPNFGQTNNPWAVNRTSGGSSGGSAAAVAAGLCYAAVGTDTGGSIRIPAAYCGIVGLKPTYGLVDLDGVQPLSWSLDHAGPMARNCSDAALLLQGMTGRPHQITPSGLAGLRIGLMEHPGSERYLETAIRDAFESTVSRLASGGAQVRGVRVPELGQAGEALLAMLGPEASVIHEKRLATHGAGFSETTRRQIQAGFDMPATAYVQARRCQHALTESFRSLFQTVDALLSPAVPWVAPAEDPAIGDDAGAGEMMYSGVYNLVGLPAASVFCGLSPDGLPIGLQIVAPWRQDRLVLSIGAAIETPMTGARPSL